MTILPANLIGRGPHRPDTAPAVTLAGDLRLSLGRVHEICGLSRRVLALALAARLTGPVLWIAPTHEAARPEPCGFSPWLDPGRVVYVAADDDLPEDALECTTDSCADGEPVFTPKPKGTFCGPMGAHYCHDDAICRRCKQLDDPCEDPGPEPNELQALAHDFGTIGDSDSAGGFVCGSVSGADDVDWYTFEGDDTIFGAVDPTRVIDGKGTSRLCVYAECLKGTTSVSCAGGTTPDTAPGGQKGCCGSGEVKPKLECSGLDDAANVWIRVDQPEPACFPYELAYHF